MTNIKIFYIVVVVALGAIIGGESVLDDTEFKLLLQYYGPLFKYAKYCHVG